MGINIQNNDGVNDYRNAFGRSPLETRFAHGVTPSIPSPPEEQIESAEIPVIPVTRISQPSNPFSNVITAFPSAPPVPPVSSGSHANNSEIIDVIAVPVDESVINNEENTTARIQPQNVTALNEDPILLSENFADEQISPQTEADLRAVLAMLDDAGTVPPAPTPKLLSPAAETIPEKANDNQPFDGFYLEAHNDSQIMRIRSTPSLDMFHGGTPPSIRDAVSELRKNSRNAQYEALSELESAVGTEAPTTFVELAQHEKERANIAKRFSAETPYTGFAETDTHYLALIETSPLDGPRTDCYPIYDFTSNGAAELIVWAKKTKYNSQADFAEAVQEHAVKTKAADFRHYRGYFNPNEYGGPDIHSAEHFPPYSNPLPEKANKKEIVPETISQQASEQKKTMFGSLEVPATRLDEYRNRTETQKSEPKSPRIGM